MPQKNPKLATLSYKQLVDLPLYLNKQQHFRDYSLVHVLFVFL